MTLGYSQRTAALLPLSNRPILVSARPTACSLVFLSLACLSLVSFVPGLLASRAFCQARRFAFCRIVLAFHLAIGLRISCLFCALPAGVVLFLQAFASKPF
jgi:hypothetical protein